MPWNVWLLQPATKANAATDAKADAGAHTGSIGLAACFLPK
jgi:hypothetical protein